MSEHLYIYAVARIRSKELSLFSRQTLEQLMALKSYEECLKFLEDKGWGEHSDNQNAETMLTTESEKTWALIRELCEDMSIFDVILYGNDYHNLKAALKQTYMGTEVPHTYISNGTISPATIEPAVKEKDFSLLPEHMRACAEEAYDSLFHTGNGQLCDIIIDKATLETIYKAGKATGNELLTEYAELKVAAADINIAVRGCKTKKDNGFFERAMAECDSLNLKELIKAALQSEDAIKDYLMHTKYADAVPAIEKSLSAFELWCDDLIMKRILPQKYNSLTVSPLAAYILARENEIKAVRLILSGKLNSLSDETVRERLREMYV